MIQLNYYYSKMQNFYFKTAIEALFCSSKCIEKSTKKAGRIQPA